MRNDTNVAVLLISIAVALSASGTARAVPCQYVTEIHAVPNLNDPVCQWECPVAEGPIHQGPGPFTPNLARGAGRHTLFLPDLSALEVGLERLGCTLQCAYPARRVVCTNLDGACGSPPSPNVFDCFDAHGSVARPASEYLVDKQSDCCPGLACQNVCEITGP